MRPPRQRSPLGGTAIGQWADWLLYRFSIYLVPAGIIVASLVVLFSIPAMFGTVRSDTLSFHVLSDPSGTRSPEQALAELPHATVTARYGTHLAETPVWVLLDPVPIRGSQKTYVDFPSRHAVSIACWAAPSMRFLGRGDRIRTEGAFVTANAGFALALTPADAGQSLLCRGTFSGPAYATVAAITEPELLRSELKFDRSTALITGGLLTLAIFVFVTAIINSEWTYVIFAAWLVGNLRLAANTLGFDTEWFGRPLPPEHLAAIREFSFAAYYLLTVALFSRLFVHELKVVGQLWMLRVVQFGGAVLLIAAFSLPYARFIPVLWVTAGLGALILIFKLGQLVIYTRSRTVMWYVASLAIVLFSMFSQVIAAAFGTKLLFGGVNADVVALSSSMMAAFAIAERMRDERVRRQKSEQELRTTYEVTPIGLFTLDRDGYFVRANAALHAMLDLDPATYGVRHWSDFFEPGAWDTIQQLARDGDRASLEIRSVPGMPGHGRIGRRYALKAILSQGAIEGSLEDVTERSRAVERLQYLVEHDPLTGALNRRGIETAVEQLSANGEPWAIAYVDLDRFKLINDMFGHAAGDEVLKHVVARMRAHVGARHRIGRIGGDEFMCVFENTSIDDAIERCRALGTALSSAPYQTGSRSFQVRASIGVVECQPGDKVQDVLAHADLACRESKRGGYGRLVAYRKGAEAFAARAREIGLIETLGQNRMPDGLFVMMQPIMSMTQPFGSLDFEALVRFRRRDGSVTGAAELIAAAEGSGQIAAVDRWVLRWVLEWVTENRQLLSHTRFVSVNLSGASLNDEQFVEEIFAMLTRYPAAIPVLCIEITESVALHDLHNTQRFIARVHDLGAKIALDDFGAGHTSFKYLKELSADALKIDGAFVKTMCEHPADMAIVEAIVALARNLGMRSIAEWVEDVQTLQALHEIGADYVQGFAIARPQDAGTILTAASAADFIVEDDILQYLKHYCATAEAPGQQQPVRSRTVV